MELSAHEVNGHPFVEGPHGHAFLTQPDAATRLLEKLLYPLCCAAPARHGESHPALL